MFGAASMMATPESKRGPSRLLAFKLGAKTPFPATPVVVPSVPRPPDQTYDRATIERGQMAYNKFFCVNCHSPQADGSGLYTVQALWTQARESLDVTTIICANRTYRILQIELLRAGVSQPGRAARHLTHLGEPQLDWVRLASAMGVPAARAEDATTLVRELERALAEPGPHLIEAILE